jgi:hypothetical protein
MEFRLIEIYLPTVKRADAQKAEEKFIQMLQEKPISQGSSWSDVGLARMNLGGCLSLTTDA